MFCHLDMDCFYASIEMREYPHLRHKPLAIGGSERRGVVTTCNYVARRFGVRSAMSGFEARQLCPEIVFLPVRFQLYREVSKQLRELLQDFSKSEFAMSSEIEMASVDEGYFEIDAEENEALLIATRLRQRIEKELGVTASLGLAPNKMLSKIISSRNKPNKHCLLRFGDVDNFIAGLPVSAIPGVGPKASARLEARGIHSCHDLQKLSLDELFSSFGPTWGWALYEKCRGRDERRLQSRRERKSLSCERTLNEDLNTQEELQFQLKSLWKEFQKRYESATSKKLMAKCYVTLRFSDFQRTTKECAANEIKYEVFESLALEALDRSRKGVRLVGMGIRYESRALRRAADPRQLDFFANRA